MTSEAAVDADWLARREAARAARAPKLPDVVQAIRGQVEELMRLADDAAAGRVPLSLFLDDEHPERVNVLAALLISRCGR